MVLIASSKSFRLNFYYLIRNLRMNDLSVFYEMVTVTTEEKYDITITFL